MAKLSVRSVVVLIVLSLCGLVVVQTWLLSYAFEQKEMAFDRNARNALWTASRRLELGEIKVLISARFNDSIAPESGRWVSRTFDIIAADSGEVVNRHKLIERSAGSIEFDLEDSCVVAVLRQPESLQVTPLDPMASNGPAAGGSFSGPGRFRLPAFDTAGPKKAQLYRVETDSASYMLQLNIDSDSLQVRQMNDDNARTLLVRNLVDQLSMGESAPFSERLDTAAIDSVVRMSLMDAGIDLECESGVHALGTDSIVYATNRTLLPQLRDSGIRARLFMSDLFGSSYDLVAHFPGRTIYIWGQIGPQVAASILLMMIIVAVFVYSARTIVRQRRFASLLTDFINNMTHEFKTPISTVALASEAIGRSDVASDVSRVSRYNEMIRNETDRMRKQTDKILQMAILEEGDYELKLEDVDLHAAIQRAVESIALLVESRGGTIISELKAEKPVVRADAVHVTNIINNLLDNAIKYSPDAPQIRVRTMGTGSGVTTEVTDQGAGISQDDLKLVWQKYFRVSSGNRHDVKGFGLGLSYVKLMTEAHGGQVSLVSVQGKGTTVSIFLPTAGPPTTGEAL